MGPGNGNFCLGGVLTKSQVIGIVLPIYAVLDLRLNKEFWFPGASLAVSPALNSFFN